VFFPFVFPQTVLQTAAQKTRPVGRKVTENRLNQAVVESGRRITVEWIVLEVGALGPQAMDRPRGAGLGVVATVRPA